MDNKKLIKQKGAALISALFITALAALLATHMAYRQSMLIHKVMQTSDQQQLLSDYQALQSWAIADIENKAKQNFNKITYMPQTVIKKDMSGWHFRVSIQDQQAFYNVNSLTKLKKRTQFANWLRSLNPDLDYNHALKIAAQAADWVANKPGADDEYYANLKPAYRAGHQPMFDTSEFNMLRAFNTNNQQMQHLKWEIQRYGVALPPDVRPNVWTVKPQVLPAYITGSGGEAAVDRFIACRKEAIANKMTKDTSAIQSCMGDGQGGGANILGALDRQSTYFLITIRASKANTIKYYTSLVHIALGAKNNINTHVLWQRYFIGAN